MGHQIFDQFSSLHFAMGVIAYFFGLTFWQWFFLHLLFELIQNGSKYYGYINIDVGLPILQPPDTTGPDHLINSLGDQTFAMTGWILAYYIDKLGKEYNWYNVTKL